jgi:hypothetical protein
LIVSIFRWWPFYSGAFSQGILPLFREFAITISVAILVGLSPQPDPNALQPFTQKSVVSQT